MKDLKYYQKIIQEKRKQTDFRDFLMEVVSWVPYGFYKNGGIISRFPQTQRVQISSLHDFEASRDNLTKSGLEYDLGVDFFTHFKTLFQSVKIPGLLQYGKNENCDFADVALDSNNAYLSSIMIGVENVFYSLVTRTNARNVFNSLFSVENSENIYSSTGSVNSFNIFYSKYINNSNNIWFSSNLTGCAECIFCTSLENTKYCIENRQFEKIEYMKRKGELLAEKHKFQSYYHLVDNKGLNHASNNVQGNFILNSQDIKNGNFVYNSKDARNVSFIGSTGGSNNFYDVCPGGGGSLECHDFFAICNAGGGSYNLYCSSQIAYSSNIFYSYYLDSCSYCIGCIGLKNKQYCILNKQYSKEDWYDMADKIFSDMEFQQTLGQYFPPDINPFYFNDTMAALLGDFNKQEITRKGYLWRDQEIKVDIPEGSEVIKTSDLADYQGYSPEGEWKINPDILNKVIINEKGDYYRVVQMEYDFLVKHSLPLPEIHWMDRMKLNFGT